MYRSHEAVTGCVRPYSSSSCTVICMPSIQIDYRNHKMRTRSCVCLERPSNTFFVMRSNCLSSTRCTVRILCLPRHAIALLRRTFCHLGKTHSGRSKEEHYFIKREPSRLLEVITIRCNCSILSCVTVALCLPVACAHIAASPPCPCWRAAQWQRWSRASPQARS
jgi:hypothetical protein